MTIFYTPGSERLETSLFLVCRKSFYLMPTALEMMSLSSLPRRHIFYFLVYGLFNQKPNITGGNKNKNAIPFKEFFYLNSGFLVSEKYKSLLVFEYFHCTKNTTAKYREYEKQITFEKLNKISGISGSMYGSIYRCIYFGDFSLGQTVFLSKEGIKKEFQK